MCLSRDEKVLALAGAVDADREGAKPAGKTVLLTLEWSDHLTHRLLYSKARIVSSGDASFDQMMELRQPGCFLLACSSRQQLLLIDRAASRLIDSVPSCRLLPDSYHILGLDKESTTSTSNATHFCLYKINSTKPLL